MRRTRSGGPVMALARSAISTPSAVPTTKAAGGEDGPDDGGELRGGDAVAVGVDEADEPVETPRPPVKRVPSSTSSR